MTNSSGLSLATKFILTMVLLLAAAVGTSALYSLNTLNQLADSQAKARRADGEAAIRTQSELLLRNAASSMGLTIAQGDFDYLKELVEQTRRENPSLEWIAIVDEVSDKYLSSTPGAPDVETMIGKDLHKALEATPRPRKATQSEVLSNDERLVFGTNAFAGEQVVGQVYISFSIEELVAAIAASVSEARNQATASARNQLLFAGLMLLVGILVAVLGSRRIARPLQQLSVQAGYIASGDFGQRVEVKSKDEIGQLAESFNSMAEKLGVLYMEWVGKAAMERELELARSVQQMMSPPAELLSVGDFALNGRCEMAVQCGGDWWTYRQLSGNRLLIVVGDVTGHGLPSAMIAATARGAVEALSMADEAIMSPPRLLEAIDRAIRDVGRSELQELHMTCFAVLLDPDKGKMTFANAGHAFPYVLRPSRTGGEPELAVLAVRGNPLGNPTQLIAPGERELAPGDTLVLLSDGLTDRVAQSGERFGEKRLRRILMEQQPGSGPNHALALTDRIVQNVSEFAGPVPLDDDLTLVVCHYTGSRRAVQRSVA